MVNYLSTTRLAELIEKLHDLVTRILKLMMRSGEPEWSARCLRGLQTVFDDDLEAPVEEGQLAQPMRGRLEPPSCFGKSLHLEDGYHGWLRFLPQSVRWPCGIDGREPQGSLPINQAETFIQSWACSKA